MRQFIESLKRLYDSHKIEESKIKEMCRQSKITADEMDYIFGKQKIQ